MTTLDQTGLPLPEMDAQPLATFWRKAQDGELHLPRCENCGRIDWYPTGHCRNCDSRDIAWSRIEGRPGLFSWAVVNRALDPRLAPLGRYISAIVTFPDDPQFRFVTRLVDAEPDEIVADMALAVRFLDLGYPAAETGIRAPLVSPLR